MISLGYKWVTKHRCLTLNLPLFRAHISLETRISFQLQEQGLLNQMRMDDRFDGIGVHPSSGGVGLEPRTFRVKSVDSFQGSFAGEGENLEA